MICFKEREIISRRLVSVIHFFARIFHLVLLFLFFLTIGFEYWSDPNNRQDGFINWQVNGQQTTSLWAAAVGPDQGTGGSGVGQRLIPEEPLALVLNLGISRTFFFCPNPSILTSFPFLILFLLSASLLHSKSNT